MLFRSSFKKPSENFNYDITYRISAPFNFNTKFNSKLLVVFATTEYKNLTKRNYLNGDISELSKKKNFFDSRIVFIIYSFGIIALHADLSTFLS